MNTFEKVQKIISEELGIDKSEITPFTTFTSLVTDSLEMVDLVLHFEDELKIEIPDGNVYLMRTVQDAVNYADQKSI